MELGSLNRAQRRAYDSTVSGSHRRDVEVQLLTKNGKLVQSFTNQHLGGVINGDDTRTPREVCEVDLFDPDYTLSWARGEHRRFDLRVIDSRFVPELDDWVSETVFTGPLWDFEREGPVLSLVAQGAERKAMGSVRNPYQAPRKTRATKVIRDLAEAAGAESDDLAVPSLPAQLPERVTVGVKRGKDRNAKKPGFQGPKRRVFKAGVEDTYWGEMSQVAQAVDRDLFTDGLGRFLLRSPRTRPSLAVTAQTLLGQPRTRRGDDGEAVNTWLVIGADPKGPKGRVEVEVGLPRKHPESAQAQAWHGKPRKVIERVENPKLRSKAAARRVGVRRRDQAMREGVVVEMECLPVIPWVRPGMLVSAPTPQGQVSARVRQWSLPLGPGADPLLFGGNRRRSRS